MSLRKHQQYLPPNLYNKGTEKQQMCEEWSAKKSKMKKKAISPKLCSLNIQISNKEQKKQRHHVPLEEKYIRGRGKRSDEEIK